MTDTLRVRDRWVMGNEARALVLVTSVLLAFGLATLYSASAIVAMNDGHAGWYYAARQSMGALASIVAFMILAKVDAQHLEKIARPLMVIAILMMLVTVLPFTESIAPRVHGSRRFILGTALQPSEFGKMAVIIWTSELLVRKGEEGMRRLTKGLLPFMAVVGVLDALAILEPDFSVAVMYTLVMAIILFAGGVRIGHFVALGVIAIPVLWHYMLRLQYAIMRIFSFLDADKAPAELSYQLRQSLIAVGSGGIFGRGFGQGRQQYGYVPMGFNDFIGATIGEEWGFLGMTALVLAFAAYTWLGIRIARQARSPFLQLVALGCTFTTSITAYLHIGVAIGLLPTTGLTLPFISYGRTNLLVSLVMTGILVNIGSSKERVFNAAATDPLMATT